MDTTTPTTAPRAPGRPSDFNDSLAAQIIELLSDGVSLRDIGKMEGMPSARTVHRWVLSNPQFAAGYKLARELQAEVYAEMALEAAMGATQLTSGADRLKWDALRWHAGRLSGRWNDKIIHEHTGNATLQVQPIQAPMSHPQVIEAVSTLLAEAELAAGLPQGDGSDAERLRKVLASGEPLHPALYASLYPSEGDNG